MVYEGVGQCAACHALSDDAAPLVGPPLTHIGTVGAFRLAGVSAEEYIRESILHPNVYLLPGYAPNVMPRGYAQSISPPEIEDLVAYLLGFK
jgi:mono/diheme cytochrome c family protein